MATNPETGTVEVLTAEVRDEVAGEAEWCRRRAAMLEGCAAALEELADRQHEGAAFAELGGGDVA
jgi:hypothetical protein